MKKGVLFTGGEGPDAQDKVFRLINKADIYGAADSGIYLAEKFLIMPDFIVGDMDSVKNAENIKVKYPDSERIILDRDKDETDTEAGLEILKQKGCEIFYIAGGSGGRTDHLIGVFSLFYRDLHPSVWILRNEIIYCIDCADEIFSIDTEPGEIISIFPVSCSISRMTSRGLKWELDRLVWKPGDAGISNIAVGKKVEISVKTGRLVLIRQMGNKIL